MITEPYIPLLNSPATNLMGQIDVRKGNSNITVSRISGAAQIPHGSLTVHFEDFRALKAPISVGVHKLFDVLMFQLTKQNGYKCSSPNALVKVSLDDYMALAGIPDTKSSKDEARKAVKGYLDTLSRISLEWTEDQTTKVKTTEGVTVKRKIPKIYSKQELLEGCGFQKGVIWAKFSAGVVQYLVDHSFITQYPVALLQLDNRKTAAYYLGKKLCYHYGLTSNVHRQRNDLISIESLMKAAPMLSLDRREPSHWRRNVLDVFEGAMNTLKSENIIDDWCYCFAKRQPIADITAELETYDKFSELYVSFKIDSFPLPTPKQQRLPMAS